MTAVDILALMADGPHPQRHTDRAYALPVAFAQALAEISPKLTPLEMHEMIKIGRELCMQSVDEVSAAMEADAHLTRIMNASRSAGG